MPTDSSKSDASASYPASKDAVDSPSHTSSKQTIITPWRESLMPFIVGLAIMLILVFIAIQILTYVHRGMVHFEFTLVAVMMTFEAFAFGIYAIPFLSYHFWECYDSGLARLMHIVDRYKGAKQTLEVVEPSFTVLDNFVVRIAIIAMASGAFLLWQSSMNEKREDPKSMTPKTIKTKPNNSH